MLVLVSWELLPTRLTARLPDTITDLTLSFNTMLAASNIIFRAVHTSESLDSLATAIRSKCSVLLTFSVYIGTFRYCTEDKIDNDAI